MYENLFKFSKRTPIWVYGHGFLGIPLYNRLLDAGYQVKGFIDRNIGEEQQNFTVITPDSLNLVSRDEIIVISFQDIVEHEKVVNELTQMGFYKIVYLNRESTSYPLTIDLFNNLIYGDQIEEFFFPITYKKNAVTRPKYYREYGNLVVVEVPVQLVFSAELQAPIELNALEGQKVWNYNISALYEYNALFDLLFYGKKNEAYFERYINRLKGKSRSESEFLNNRINLFDRMIQDYSDYGISAFRNTPSQASFDKNTGRFILEDGHHRAVFLMYMGNNVIPIRMTRNDYLTWLNADCADEVMRKMAQVGPIHAPVFNPIISPFDNNIGLEAGKVANALAKFFSCCNVIDMTALDVHSNTSFFSRIIKRLGIEKVYAYEENEKMRKFACNVNHLENVSGITIMDSLPSEQFDIVLCMEHFYDDGGETEVESRIMQYVCFCKSFYTTCLGGNIKDNAEILRNKYGFKKCKILYTFYSINKWKGIVVFER